MNLNKYVVSREEKKAIQNILETENRFKLNFILSSVEDNLIMSDSKNTNADILRDTKKYIDIALKVYSGMCKQKLNSKQEPSKVYIPISKKEYTSYLSNDKFNGFLVGTTQKFVAEAKPYPEIEDLVILEAEIKNIPIYNSTEEDDEEFVILRTKL